MSAFLGPRTAACIIGLVVLAGCGLINNSHINPRSAAIQRARKASMDRTELAVRTFASNAKYNAIGSGSYDACWQGRRPGLLSHGDDYRNRCTLMVVRYSRVSGPLPKVVADLKTTLRDGCTGFNLAMLDSQLEVYEEGGRTRQQIASSMGVIGTNPILCGGVEMEVNVYDRSFHPDWDRKRGIMKSFATLPTYEDDQLPDYATLFPRAFAASPYIVEILAWGTYFSN